MAHDTMPPFLAQAISDLADDERAAALRTWRVLDEESRRALGEGCTSPAAAKRLALMLAVSVLGGQATGRVAIRTVKRRTT